MYGMISRHRPWNPVNYTTLTTLALQQRRKPAWWSICRRMWSLVFCYASTWLCVRACVRVSQPRVAQRQDKEDRMALSVCQHGPHMTRCP
jgi:hypothetical protein